MPLLSPPGFTSHNWKSKVSMMTMPLIHLNNKGPAVKANNFDKYKKRSMKLEPQGNVKSSVFPGMKRRTRRGRRGRKGRKTRRN
jgi:hypothetical protein